MDLTPVVAWLGLGVSVALAVIKIVEFRRDRADLRVAEHAVREIYVSPRSILGKTENRTPNRVYVLDAAGQSQYAALPDQLLELLAKAATHPWTGEVDDYNQPVDPFA